MESMECTEIIRRHPELILISNDPVTWEGMLSISVNSIEKSKVRIKLTLPSYPRFEGANLKFGKNSAILYNKVFAEKSNNLLRNAFSVTSFLKQLQMGDVLQINVSKLAHVGDYSVFSELEALLCSSCEVRLSLNHGLNLIELRYRNICVRLQRDASCSHAWKIASCDLAQLQGCELVIGATMNLRDVAQKLEKQVDSLENVWNHLEDVDRNCWVIDPLVPKPHHMYRRIRLTPSLSVLINVNPSESTSLPPIKILGSDSEVQKYREILSNNLKLWDPNNGLFENLLLLLDLQEFPQRPTTDDAKHKDSGLFDDEECCICFSLELDENVLPDRVCDNEKCQKHFHTACLLQWLQAIPGNLVVFNQLYGSCPHCGQNILCPVK